jgi:activator of HSP90 ATPase
MPKTATVKVTFEVPDHVIYKMFVEQHSIMAYTRCPAVCVPSAGGKLVMFDGMIEGEFVTLEENKRIQMKWKFREWPTFADLTMSFEHAGEDACEIILQYSNVPDTDSFGSPVNLEKLNDGWRQNIFRNIRMIFGYPLRDD